MPCKFGSGKAPSDVVRWWVIPARDQTHLQLLSFSRVFTYIFQFNPIAFNEIWNTLNYCASLEWSSDVGLHPEAVWHLANLIWPLDPGPTPVIHFLLWTPLKWGMNPISGPEGQVRQTSTRNGLGMVASALGWKRVLLQAVAAQFSVASRKFCHVMVRLLYEW